MDSIKTAVVVTVLMVVGYAVYQAIHNNLGPAAKKQLTELVTSDPEDAPAEADRTAGSNSPWGRQGTSRTPSSPPRSEARDSRGESSTFARRNARDADRIADGSPDGRGAETPSSAPTFPRLPSRQLREPQRAATTPDRPLATDSPRRTPSEDVAAADFPNARRQAQTAPRPDPAQDSAVQQAGYEARQRFRETMDDVQKRLEQGGPQTCVEVLLQLSRLYGRPGLSPEESEQLGRLLGQLAGTVIYSREHLLEPPYVVQAGDSLRQIAQRYAVPWQLLAKINGVSLSDPDRLQPGRQLKLVRGPFDVVVYLDRYELVLLLGELYAGRFPIGIGRDQPSLEGQFVVREKSTQRPYYGPDGMIDAGDPRNPLGKYWIGLTEHIGIHGTSDPRSLRRADNRGTICLGQRDIEDLFDILSAESESSAGSRVIVQR